MRLLAAAVLILGAGIARAQDTVYELSFQAGGEQVTGTLTLSGGVEGPVRSGNVLSYDFGSALASAVYFNDQGGGGGFASLGLSFDEILGTASGRVAAPEIDPSDAAAALTLLLGFLAMRTGRRNSIG